MIRRPKRIQSLFNASDSELLEECKKNPTAMIKIVFLKASSIKSFKNCRKRGRYSAR